MSIPIGVNRIVVTGHLTGGEIFATSFWTQGNVPGSQALANVFAANVASLFQVRPLPTLKGLMDATCGYDSVKTYHYPTGGPAATYLGVSAIASGAGNSAAGQLTLQSAMVASLRTQLAGRSHRGRMYFPCVSGALTSHQHTNPTVSNVAADVAGFFSDVKVNSSVGIPVVVSQVGAGSYTPITQVIVDSRLDVQRRRANKIVPIITTTSNVP